MLVGHLGLALIGKRARPDAPLALLTGAAFLPDVVRAGLDLVVSPGWTNFLSHSIPSALVLAGVSALAAVARPASRKAGIAVLAAALCVSHLPADYLTGCKPTWFRGPYLGLNLYQRPLYDLALELPLLIAGLRLARPVLAGERLFPKRWVFSVCLTAQIAFLIYGNGALGACVPDTFGRRSPPASRTCCPSADFVPPWDKS
jgi:hypothetical protein